MDTAHYMEPTASQIHAQHQTRRTSVVVRAIFNDFSALDGLTNIRQADTGLIKRSLRVRSLDYPRSTGLCAVVFYRDFLALPAFLRFLLL